MKAFGSYAARILIWVVLLQALLQTAYADRTDGASCGQPAVRLSDAGRVAIVSTPEPDVTPVPVDTFCDIPVFCDIYVYNAEYGESHPLSSVLIDLMDDTCGSDWWSTDESGWSAISYIHHRFDLDLILSKPMFYDVTFTANSQNCPASIGMFPMHTQSPAPPNNGDVNHDQQLTAEDAQLAFMIALGLYYPDPEQWAAADCDGSGDVSAGDAQLIFLAVMQQGWCADPLI